MYKAFLTIALFCCIFKTHAQDKRFVYTDSSLLEGSASTEDTSAGAYGNTNEDQVIDILSDTTLYIGNINIAPDSVIYWKKDERFAYIKNLDSLLKDKQKQDSQHDDKPGKADSFLIWLLNSAVIRMLFWAIAIFFVSFILYRLFLSSGIFNRNSRSLPVDRKLEDEQNRSASDYDKLIQQSRTLGDYRLAVRYLFLKNLVHLADKEFLQLSADKTNYQYVQEIAIDKKNEFSSLVLTYEYIWYGNFPLNLETYTGIEKRFNSFYNKTG